MKRFAAILALCFGAAVAASVHAAATPYPLGSVIAVVENPNCTPVNGVSPCGKVTNKDCERGRCTLITVSCPGVAEDRQAILRVRVIPGSAPRDTALFLTGGPGNTLWGEDGTPARNGVTKLKDAGFRTVELAWIGQSWAVGDVSPDVQACRPATAAQYVYDKYRIGQTGGYFHVTGNSAGSAQLAYMLSRYGLDTKINVAVPTSGPPFARFDLGCLRPEQVGFDPALVYDDVGRGLVDRTFGHTGKNGPCQTVIAEPDLTTYRDASLAYGDNDYYHPTTFVQFIFGSDDVTNSVAQGQLYYDRLFDAGTPYLAQTTVPNVPHELPRFQDGVDAVTQTMLDHRNPQ